MTQRTVPIFREQRHRYDFYDWLPKSEEIAEAEERDISHPIHARLKRRIERRESHWRYIQVAVRISYPVVVIIVT